MARYWPVLSASALMLAIMWIASQSFDPFVFPPLPAIAAAFWKIITTQYDEVAVTLLRYLVAFAMAIFCGWLVGLLMGAFRQTFGRFMQAFISIVQAVPALAWILFAVLWMQSVEARIGFVTFIIAFPFFVIAVYEGVRDMDRDILEAIEQFRPNRMQTLRILLLPQSVTHLIIAMRSTAAMTLKLMVLAEVLAANNGIGRAMATAQSNFSIDALFAWAFLLVLLNFVLIRIISQIEKRALRWRAEAVVR
ncbi:ABC transporter permease subunit [Marivita sp. S6314]|uniref:ABC transporter permease n=1 Tax=Marivita sp. S6314 TaxID=2926406 RepID=UPI001FF17F8F|nr:ABC transporter permease subunit [Marivita sp. S6314]MCK0150858.1 ABC transporter permease subunit [Marivita sp. S6314]